MAVLQAMEQLQAGLERLHPFRSRHTGRRSRRLVFPDWLAVMEQVPIPTIVTVVPDTVQTAGVVEVKVTASPELGVAVIAKGIVPAATLLSPRRDTFRASQPRWHGPCCGSPRKRGFRPPCSPPCAIPRPVSADVSKRGRMRPGKKLRMAATSALTFTTFL
jgi:hypothetical protein